MKLSIKQRLIVGVSLTLIITISVVVIGIAGMRSIGHELRLFIDGNSRTHYLSQKIMSDINHSARLIRDAYISNADTTKRNNYIKDLNGAMDTLNNDITELGNLITSEQKPSFDKVKNDIDKWLTIGDDIVTSLQIGDLQKATKLIAIDCPAALKDTEQSEKALIAEIEEETTVTSQRLENFVANQTIILIAALAFLIVVFVYVAYRVLSRILQPVKKLQSFADEIKRGNLNAVCEYESSDEMGILSANLSEAITQWRTYIEDISVNLDKISRGDLEMSKGIEYVGDFSKIKESIEQINISLNETMAHIKSSSEQVASGSVQVASGSQSLAQGSSQQANSVEELATSIVQISDQVNSNADNSKAANDMSTIISEKINYSNQQMQKMMVAMESITKKSNEINKIIKTIEDIAFNTNILALNAAVEAARAGTAGKGFAVVADEVRNLASKSSEAAKNTTKLIEDSIKAVEDGTEIANTTAQSLYDVVNGASEIIDFVNKIAVSSEEQAGSISQVTIGIDQISSVVQINSATSEEIAAASEQLREQANILKSLVSKFKVAKGFEKTTTSTSNLISENNTQTSDEEDYFEDFNIISKY